MNKQEIGDIIEKLVDKIMNIIIYPVLLLGKMACWRKMDGLVIMMLVVFVIGFMCFLFGIYYSVVNFNVFSTTTISEKGQDFINQCLIEEELEYCYSEYGNLEEQGYFDVWHKKIVEKIIIYFNQ